MQLTQEFFKTAKNKYPAFLDRLQELFDAMDRAYNEAAEYYQFSCSGCTDSCCLTRFYHHTFLEYLYLLTGYQAAAKDKQITILKSASTVCRETAAADQQAIRVRHMCPLNFDGLCSLYAYRPMICRMHGIAHELHQPGKAVSYAPGCHEFTKQCGQKEYHSFDRIHAGTTLLSGCDAMLYDGSMSGQVCNLLPCVSFFLRLRLRSYLFTVFIQVTLFP